MILNKIKINLLAVAIATPLFFTACSENKQQGHEAHSETPITEGEDMKKEDPNKIQQIADSKVFENVAEATKEHINGLLQKYYELKDALVQEKADKAKTAGNEIMEELETFDKSKLDGEQKTLYEEHVSKIKEDAEHIMKTGEVSHQRDHLPTLTKNMYSMVKAYNANEKTLYYQYCPMAMDNNGAYWLSESKEIENPYFGDKMLKCGSTKETLEAKN